MSYRATVHGERHSFPDLRTLLAKANERKSGDELAGLAADGDAERAAAKLALADVTLREVVDTPLVDDDVTGLIESGHDRTVFAPLASLTVGEWRERILSPRFPAEWRLGLARAITPEMAAAVAKLMSNRDLVSAASTLHPVTRCRSTVGLPGRLSVRIQPNHPTDDLAGVVLATLDGLLYGCGDAVIGVNPAAESVGTVTGLLRGLGELVAGLDLPTQTCVLAHVTTQLAALDAGAPVDLVFQSIGGTQATNAAFGVSPALLTEAAEAVAAHHASRPGEFVGSNRFYFETGQGSALSAGGHAGIDQLTCEARAYGVARAFDPFLVNSVVGFIGPEYLADERQIIRAGLEDHFMGKLLGLPMGVDVCYTNHVDADPNSADNLLLLLALAGCTYVMGVPGSDDVMLGYQSTSYHDAASVRELLGLRPTPEFEAWLVQRGLWVDGRLVDDPTSAAHDLARQVARALGPAGASLALDPVVAGLGDGGTNRTSGTTGARA